MRVTIALIASLLFASAAEAAVVQTTHIGNWTIQTYDDDRTGKFDSCEAQVGYPAGTLEIVIKRDVFALGLSKPQWNLPPNAQYTVALYLRTDSDSD